MNPGVLITYAYIRAQEERRSVTTARTNTRMERPHLEADRCIKPLARPINYYKEGNLKKFVRGPKLLATDYVPNILIST